MTDRPDDRRRRTVTGHWTAHFRSFQNLYAQRFYSSVRVQLIALMCLIEAIFLAERFPMVFRDVLKNHAGTFDTLLIFLSTSTQIFDLALAISILAAVYWTVLRMREDRELLVLFSAGAGPLHLIFLTLTIAAAGQAGSLAVSGVIDPLSRYAQRSILFDAQFRVLKNGGASGQFLYLGNRVAFSPAQPGSQRDSPGAADGKPVFVYEKPNPDTFRVMTAAQASITAPDSAGNLLLRLGGFSSWLFLDDQPASGTRPSPAQPVAPAPGSERAPLQPDRVFTSDFARMMAIEELMPFAERGSDAAELTVFEQLFGLGGAPRPRRLEEMRLLGERFSRSLLCLLAPPIALAAVSLTSRRTNYLALPVASMLLLSLNIAGEWLIRAIEPTAPLAALVLPASLAAGMVATLVLVTIRRQNRLIRPQLARA